MTVKISTIRAVYVVEKDHIDVSWNTSKVLDGSQILYFSICSTFVTQKPKWRGLLIYLNDRCTINKWWNRCLSPRYDEIREALFFWYDIDIRRGHIVSRDVENTGFLKFFVLGFFKILSQDFLSQGFSVILSHDFLSREFSVQKILGFSGFSIAGYFRS